MVEGRYESGGWAPNIPFVARGEVRRAFGGALWTEEKIKRHERLVKEARRRYHRERGTPGEVRGWSTDAQGKPWSKEALRLLTDPSRPGDQDRIGRLQDEYNPDRKKPRLHDTTWAGRPGDPGTGRLPGFLRGALKVEMNRLKPGVLGDAN